MGKKKYATVSWAIEDVLELRPNWTRQQAKEAMRDIEKAFTDRLVNDGNEALDLELAAWEEER